MSVSASNGKIAEVLVELNLLRRGWHVERLDGSAKAANGDLIAIKGKQRPIIQVKGALSWDRPSFGHATRFLKDGTPFFNSKNAAILADFLVTVSGSSDEPLMHVFPICEAERLAQEVATGWLAKPKRDGCRRSPNFPVSLGKSDPRILPFAEAWHLLDTKQPS